MDLQTPTIPNEIILEILSNLGKNDLLKSRLVNQSWNKLCLKILRNPKYDHEHELTQDNIGEFLEFSKEKNEEWVLPFHLNFRRDEDSVDYQQIPKYIQQLQNIFGEKCVVGLTLSHESSSSLECVKELMSILSLIAPSLTHLDLSQFKLRLQEEGEMKNIEEMLRETQLNFPNLSKLISCPSPIWLNEQEDNEENQENEIHSFLIERSKDLKELEVISPVDLIDHTIFNHIGSLRKLKIVSVLQDMDMYLLSMRTCPVQPVLKDLSFNYSAPSVDHEILNEFLTSFSTTLQSLTIIFREVPTNPFPKLSQLTYLGIQVKPEAPTSSTARYHSDLQKLNLNSETFPVLESMDISTNVQFGSADANSGNWKDDLSLPTVKNLIVRVTDSPFNARAPAKEYVDHLHQIFPNVTSLSLVDECEWSEDNLSEMLIAFVQSDGAPKIQELEIQNCEENYLGQMSGLDPNHQPLIIIKNLNLNVELFKAIEKAFKVTSGGGDLKVDNQTELSEDGEHDRVLTCKAPIHLKITGLEKIHMSCSKTFHPKYRPRECEMELEQNQKDLFLMSLPKHLPLLKQIDISQQMFGDDKEVCEQQIASVQERFPDLIIDTTR